MPTFSELKTGRKEFSDTPLPSAHWLEHHYIQRKLSWADAAKQLVALFPRDTRPERPRPWYGLLAGTHWPGQVPPGNGPFYVPDWVFEGMPEAEADGLRKHLTANGFSLAVAHVAQVPENSEYLAAAMRVAGPHAWTVNPITYRVYVYPKLHGFAKAPLRQYTTTRWQL